MWTRQFRLARTVLTVLLVGIFGGKIGLAQDPANKQDPEIIKIVGGMTDQEKIGQLFMVAAYSNKDKAHQDQLLSLVREQKIGGVIFFQGGPGRQVAMTNALQGASQVPLMVGMDAEWGLNMRLDSVDGFPKQMMLAASSDCELTYEMGQVIGDQLNRIGVHVNFAPVVDVNNNPKNPVIGMRSFGQDKKMVTELSQCYMFGMHQQGVLACAKHFPGHGDTEFDSHKTLPAVTATAERIDSVELYPYKVMIDKGLRSVMAAHLHVPSLKTVQGTATSLSEPVINGLLRSDLGFNGLVFTDALNMKGVSDYYETGELELKALQAGNDVLLFSEDVPKAAQYLLSALEDGRLAESTVDAACYRMLKEKKTLGILKGVVPVPHENLLEEINSPTAELVSRQLIEKSITLVQNKDDLLPLKRLDTLSIAAVSITDNGNEDFVTGLERYAPMDKYVIRKKPSDEERQKLYDALEGKDLVIIGVHGNSISMKANYGIPPQILRTVRDINLAHRTAVAVFANPYSLRKFYGLKDVDAVVMAYEDRPLVKDICSQAIFGGVGFAGTLPVDASLRYKAGEGIKTDAIRFKYTVPEDAGLARENLAAIDKYAQTGITEGAYPGCQVLVAKDGKVIFNKSYGHHKYDGERPVTNADLYDLASVTKIAATTSSVMRLTDDGRISIDSTLGKYIPSVVKGTAYNNVVLRQMMAHQAGFFPWLPFYRRSMTRGKYKPGVYTTTPDAEHTVQVADNLYIGASWRDTILWRITQEPISWRKKYKYSDFGFYMLHKAVEEITGVPFQNYTDSVFYKPLGLKTMTYNPLNKFSLDRITPTENDTTYRKQLVHGFVHDQGAAMMGGVSGHAGLFSNANDLGVMMQMLVNGGTYGGERYIQDSTLLDFTRCQYCDNSNRRGAGFDKPVRGGGSGPTCSGCVSLESFGHTGFTGITTWGDPDKNVVYVFLSNRVYPIADNKKILRLNTRTDIQQVIYDAIEKGLTNEFN